MIITVRPAEIRDIDELMVIDMECFSLKATWERQAFVAFLGNLKQQLFVIEGEDSKTLGFFAIQHGHRWIKILRFCVCPLHRRKMIGTLAIGWLKRSLINYQDDKKTQLRAIVRADDTESLQFFKANDFCAVSVYPQYFGSGKKTEDGILIRWSVVSENNNAKGASKIDLRNRISKHFNA